MTIYSLKCLRKFLKFSIFFWKISCEKSSKKHFFLVFKAEIHDYFWCERFGVIMEHYLLHAGENVRQLAIQNNLNIRLQAIIIQKLRLQINWRKINKDLEDFRWRKFTITMNSKMESKEINCGKICLTEILRKNLKCDFFWKKIVLCLSDKPMNERMFGNNFVLWVRLGQFFNTPRSKQFKLNHFSLFTRFHYANEIKILFKSGDDLRNFANYGIVFG